MTLTIERCNSLAYADEIKSLFVRNDRPGFPAFFDRAYRIAVTAGGGSWIARDGLGSMVGHLAAFPRVFRTATETARAALLVDNLFDAPHRNFWSALELCRRAFADLCADGGFDFAYTDPTPPGEAFVKAMGFARIGTQTRFVLPLHPLYRRLFAIKARAVPLAVERVGGTWHARVAEALRALPPGGQFRGERSPDLYAMRLGGETIPDWQWLLLRPRQCAGAEVAGLVLTTGQPEGGVLHVMDIQWHEGRVSPASLLHAVAQAARQDGFKKLSVVTIAESRFARALRGCGFIRRSDALPLAMRVCRDGAALPPVSDWLLTALDGSAW